MKKIFCLLIALLLCGLSNTATGEGDNEMTVAIGQYPDPIEWLVLAEKDNQMLLLSKDALASLPWHNTHTAVTWDQSDLRAWLNGEFLETAFSKEEQAAILVSDLDNGDDYGYGTPVGDNTQDKVFLLSVSEMQTYLPEPLRAVTPTRQAVSQGAYTNGAGQCAWWLRSPGMTPTSPAYLASAGSIGSRAHEVNETIIGVRPAMWVSKSALEGDKPTEAKALYDWANSLDSETLSALTDQPLTNTGVVTYIGTDIHGLPSFRLSDSADGSCFVHACLKSEAEYGNIQVGDTVIVTGNFHVLSQEWGVVLKSSVVE